MKKKEDIQWLIVDYLIDEYLKSKIPVDIIDCLITKDLDYTYKQQLAYLFHEIFVLDEPDEFQSSAYYRGLLRNDSFLSLNEDKRANILKMFQCLFNLMNRKDITDYPLSFVLSKYLAKNNNIDNLTIQETISRLKSKFRDKFLTFCKTDNDISDLIPIFDAKFNTIKEREKEKTFINLKSTENNNKCNTF